MVSFLEIESMLDKETAGEEFISAREALFKEVEKDKIIISARKIFFIKSKLIPGHSEVAEFFVARLYKVNL